MTILITGDGVVNDPYAVTPVIEAGRNGEGSVGLLNEGTVVTQGIEIGLPIFAYGRYPSEYGGLLVYRVNGSSITTNLEVGSAENRVGEVNFGDASVNARVEILESASLVSYVNSPLNIGTSGGRATVTVSRDGALLAARGDDRQEIRIGEGAFSNGYLQITATGVTEAGLVTVGVDGGYGLVRIDGAGSRLNVANNIYGAAITVGQQAGTGRINVSDGGAINVSGGNATATVRVGVNEGSSGSLLLTGDSTLNISSDLPVYSYGYGSRSYSSQLDVGVSGNGLVAAYTGSSISVTGESARVKVGGDPDLDFGQADQAQINLFGGGLTITATNEGQTASMVIGGTDDNDGQVIVADITVFDSELERNVTHAGDLQIGGGADEAGRAAGLLVLGGESSQLSVLQGGTVSVQSGARQAATVVVGGEVPPNRFEQYSYYGYDQYETGSDRTGTIVVDGDLTSFHVGNVNFDSLNPYGASRSLDVDLGASANLFVGDGDNNEGTLAVTGGARLTVADEGLTHIARSDGSEGTIIVSGDNSRATFGGHLLVSGGIDFFNPDITPVFTVSDGYEAPLVPNQIITLNAREGGEGLLVVNDGATLTADDIFIGFDGSASLEGDINAYIEVHGEFAVDAEGIDTLSLVGELEIGSAARVFIDIADFGAGDGDTIEVDGRAIIDTATSLFVIELDAATDVVAGDVFTYLTATEGVTADTRVVFDLNRGIAFELGTDGSALTLTALEDAVAVVPVLEAGFNQRIIGSTSSEELVSLIGGATLIGNEGDDTLRGAYNDVLSGGLGNDLLISGINNNLFAGRGNDTIVIDESADRVRAGLGDDLFRVTGDVNTLLGGGGNDTLSFEDVDTGIQFDLTTVVGNTGPSITVFEAIEGLIGTGSADTLLGSSDDNQIEGGRGGDDIQGRDGDDLLSGGVGLDTLDGGADDDTLDGGSGSDLLIGGEGRNVLIGGAGADTLDGSGGGIDIASFETSTRAVALALGGDAITARGDARTDTLIDINGLRGTDFNDTLGGGNLDNILQGGGGNDLLFGFGGLDSLDGNDGDDTLDGGEDSDTLNGDLGNDSLLGGVGADFLFGGDGDDTLFGGFDEDRDILSGGLGNDLLFAAPGIVNPLEFDFIDGGGGDDTLTFENEIAAVAFDLKGVVANSGAGENSFVGLIENLTGGAGSDVLRGDDIANKLVGGAGVDRLIGRNGNDTLEGGLDNDLLRAGNDNDLLDGGAANDTLQGDAGADTLIGGEGADTLIGGDSTSLVDQLQVVDRDVASYETATSRVRADLLGGLSGIGDAAGDIFSGIEDLKGSDFNDTLFGDNLENILDGGGDNDFLRGKGGADTILGGDGEDTIRGEDDNDDIRGGEGADLVSAGKGNDLVEGGAGADTLDGGEETFDSDTLSYESSALGVDVDLLSGDVSGGDAQGDVVTGFENVTGSAQADRLEGDNASNRLEGGDGADVLVGRGGSDLILGGAGDDTISGGGGANDIIIGGTGVDVLIGNGGGDVFAFTDFSDSGVGAGNRDVIRDFNVAQNDLIDLSGLQFGLLAAPVPQVGEIAEQPLQFGGTAFTGLAGEVIARIVDPATTLVQIDRDGDQISDFDIELDGAIELELGVNVSLDLI
ncbi:MAG: beta strand repeat-containing protein [Pikeienuella sp.]